MAIKKYLEIIEELTETEMLEKKPQIVRIEVQDEVEAKNIVKEYEPAFIGRNYQKRMVISKHFVDANLNRPSEVVGI